MKTGQPGGHRLVLLSVWTLSGLLAATTTALADDTTGRDEGDWGGTTIELPQKLRGVPTLQAVIEPIKGDDGTSAVGQCPQEVSSHTNADFTGGQFVVQAGFEQGEIAAVSFTLSPSDFPLQIDLMEMIFATSNATVSTTTEWSILVWEGTPNNGTLVAEYSSDGVILPHIVLPPGTSGVNVQVSVDPGDPEQIIVSDNGSHTFSFGYRIDAHNAPGTPCTSAPPSNMNTFPTTDVGGLAAPSQNWIYAVDGTLCLCGSGWLSFTTLPGFCTPSGDWVMRATWHPFFCEEEPGQCCLESGACTEVVASECALLGGDFAGEGTTCLDDCPPPIVACCFVGGGCLDLDATTCAAAGGFPQPFGSECATTECFPEGACCLPDGTCMDGMSPEDCTALAGTFQGDGSECSSTVCPDPEGACCFDTGFCLSLTEADCLQAAATWMGFDSDCEDDNNDGTADDCQSLTPCDCDLDDDGDVDIDDLLAVLGGWSTPSGDCTGDGTTDVNDLLAALGDWGPC